MAELTHILFHINSALSLKGTLTVALAGVLMGLFVDITYQITHTHVQTDPFFHASLPVASLLCAVVIWSASGIGVLCLTAVTAMYGLFVGKMNRSRVKDARIFLVWAIACGTLCGEEKFMIAAMLCGIIFFIFLFFRLIDNMAYLLAVRGERPHRMQAQAAVFDLFGKKARLITGVTDGSTYEIVYKISSGALRKFERQKVDLAGVIHSTPGVQTVSIGKEEQHDEW